MPPMSMTAGVVQAKGKGTLAARNFGFYNNDIYNDLTAMAGSDILTGGKSWSTQSPGNSSATILNMINSGGLPIKIDQPITIVIPGLGTYKGAMQTGVQNKMSQTPVYPGTGNSIPGTSGGNQ